MPNLLQRFAADIFWLGRYVERAEALARLIDINKTYARSEPDAVSWERLLRIYGDRERYLESHGDEPNPQAILAFYLLDEKNFSSAAYAIRAARNNARGSRHLISTEMWTHLNIFHHRMEKLTLRDLRLSNVSAVCEQIKIDCQTFEGIVEGTLSRGEAWNFYTLGKQIERADQTTRVLDIGYLSMPPDSEDALASVQWVTLLRTLGGYQAYRMLYPTGRYARTVVRFLAFDPVFTRSVRFCVTEAVQCLDWLRDSAGLDQPAALRVAADTLRQEFTDERADALALRDVHDYMDGLQQKLGALSSEIDSAYFPNDEPQ